LITPGLNNKINGFGLPAFGIFAHLKSYCMIVYAGIFQVIRYKEISAFVFPIFRYHII